MRTRSRCWALVAVTALVVAGCGTAPTTPTAVSVPVKAPAPSLPLCAPCSEQIREIERLRQEVAVRDETVRELRSNERVQVKVLQESRREATRAKVKLRRLATRADAASYIAEVEVAMDSLRSSRAATTAGREIAAAQSALDSTAAPFADGDYGSAMDRAAEAERWIAQAAQRQSSPARGNVSAHARARSKGNVAGKLRSRTLGMAGAKKSG
jgi:hypothetical protein